MTMVISMVSILYRGHLQKCRCPHFIWVYEKGRVHGDVFGCCMDCRVKIEKCRIFGTVYILVSKMFSVENGYGNRFIVAEGGLVDKKNQQRRNDVLI